MNQIIIFVFGALAGAAALLAVLLAFLSRDRWGAHTKDKEAPSWAQIVEEIGLLSVGESLVVHGPTYERVEAHMLGEGHSLSDRFGGAWEVCPDGDGRAVAVTRTA